MKATLKIIGVLTAVCVICAFLLSFVYSSAKEKVALNAGKRVKAAIMNLAPETVKSKEIEVSGQTVYKLLNGRGAIFAYAFIAEGEGYQGNIKMLATINPALSQLKGVEVVESTETPGLGAKINDAPFRGQFKDLSVSPEIECVKEKPSKGNQIEAITGATVSSAAVVNILNKTIELLKANLK